MSHAFYPGSFDPPTFGHLDLIRRAAAMFERLVVAVAENPEKRPWFTPVERVEMLRELVRDLRGVEVRSFAGLTVAEARAAGCTVLFRGTRSVADFDYEYAMAMTNRVLAPEIDTVFVMPSAEWSFCSSRLVREAARLGADVARFVPPSVLARVRVRAAVRPGGGTP